jgi:hypothetical protein
MRLIPQPGIACYNNAVIAGRGEMRTLFGGDRNPLAISVWRFPFPAISAFWALSAFPE